MVSAPLTADGISTFGRPPGQRVERHRGGVRDVQALDRAGRLEAHQPVAFLAREPTHSLAFGAEHDRDPRRRVDRFDRIGEAAVETEAQEAHLAELVERAREVRHPDQRDMFEPARGRLGEDAGIRPGRAAPSG